MAEDDDINRLMARLADGDRSVFTGVFRSLWPPVSRLCLKVLRSEADADDAAQEVMAKILGRASDYDPARPALPWALGIAAWECRTLLRKRGRRKEAPEQGASELPSKLRVEEEILRRDLVRAALGTMGSLSPADQETLRLTFAEADSPVGGATFRKRRERALGRLRVAFRKLYGID